MVSTEDRYFYMFILYKLFTRVFEFVQLMLREKKYSDLEACTFRAILELPNVSFPKLPRE